MMLAGALDEAVRVEHDGGARARCRRTTSSKLGNGITPSGTERPPSRKRGRPLPTTSSGGMWPAFTQRSVPSAGSTTT